MNYIICLTVFAAITIYAFVLIFGKSAYRLQLPFGIEAIQINRGEAFILLTLAMGPVVASISGFFQVTRLLSWIIFAFLLFYRARSQKWLQSPVIVLYLLYLGWLMIGLLYSPVPGMGLRILAKYLLPLIMLLTTLAWVRQPGVGLTGIVYTFRIFWIAVFVHVYAKFFFLGFIRPALAGLFWWFPAIVDSLSVAVACTWVLFEHLRRKKYLLWIVFFAAVPVFAVVRTGIGAIGATLATIFLFKYKVKALPLLAAAFLIGSALVLYVPTVRDKTFYDTSFISDEFGGSLSQVSLENVNSSGRFYMWEHLLYQFFHDRELTGSGLGIQQSYMYEQMRVIGGVGICHNDYVQILCDSGLIGLILYLAVLLCLVVHSFLIYSNPKYHPNSRYTGLVAGASMVGLMVSMYTDNVVNYTMVTLVYPFVFYGISLALKDKVEYDQCSNSTVQ